VVEDFIADTEASSLRAKYRQESAAVKGERSETEGRESKTSVLDGGATGGSLGKAMAPNAR
jgi:2-polyprenyl-3-methyl-5-hydroxy-6-metoxy-1,4-benzoquinol methylase